MTPSGRFSACVALLALIEDASHTAEKHVTAYFRARRYAGSKDRRWISDHIFEILRRRGELDWAAGKLGLTADPRSRILLALLLFDQISADEIPIYFDGKFSEADLSDAESALVSSLDIAALYADMPDHAAGNYPQWLEAALKTSFGDEILREMKAFTAPARLNLRVNSLKAARPDVLAQLSEQNIAAGPTDYSPDGIYIDGRHNITQLPLYRDGMMEIQDEAAQICARLVDAHPGMEVVDYCAGGGGKSLAIAATMENQGQIHAFDISAARMRNLDKRAKRAGVDIIQSHILGDDAGAAHAASLLRKADRVIVDAPCSGSGTWRRQPDQKWRLDEAGLADYATQQLEILSQASALVAPEGRLIYATCSILDQENGAVIDAFCKNHPEFSLLSVSDIWGQTGLGGSYGEPHLQLTPYRHATDGFFTAILVRAA